MKCDFCSAPEVAWRYPAKDFLLGPGLNSQGDWMACDDCHRLIAENKMDDLAAKSVQCHQETAGVIDPAFVRWAHQRFLEHRDGPPMLINRGQQI